MRDLARLTDGPGLEAPPVRADSPCTPESRWMAGAVIAFASNDYLGLANHPDVVAAAREGARSLGRRQRRFCTSVSGHLRPKRLEEQGSPPSSAWRADLLDRLHGQLAVAPALVGRRRCDFADKLNHASLIDAAQLSRAEHVRYPHNDIAALAAPWKNPKRSAS